MRVSRAGRVTGITAMLVIAVSAPGADHALAQVAADDFPTAVVAAGQLGALATSCWVLLVLASGAAHVRMPGVPASLRALLFTTVIVTAVAGPARAETTHDLDGLTLPDRPSIVQTPSVSGRSSPKPPASPGVTVGPGDTLWSIATEHLPQDASVADVARDVERWYAANRRLVGPDPDLVHPGQVLTPPHPEQDDS